MFRPGFLFCILAALYHADVNALPTISAIGSKFFTSEGDQFFIKGQFLFIHLLHGLVLTVPRNTTGVAYQLVAADPLADRRQCQLDATLMKELGANSIRVYHVDPQLDHGDCMQIFADAGIYLWVDLDTFHTYVKMVNFTPSPKYLTLMLC